ncbi:MAG TPA: PQQ-dependent sugar dehydrogenase [Atopostipes sp.]|nr:PQQ-dependent sugar dehydrogenase [Atopostipes sp.]
MKKINDTFYVSERPGTIVQIKDGEQTRQEVEFTNDVSNAAEAGFMGFVLTPDFEDFNTAYAYYTYTDDHGQFNRIATFRLERNQWFEEEILLDEIPSGTVHHGGRLKIGPDDKLYATVGDASNPNLAQDLEVLPGKILRMNLDGSIPENNPFEDSYIFSYGHRNPQGMTWLEDSTMYASEHGNRANDEVNLIEAGNNYGWPLIEGEQQQSDLIAPEFTSGQTTTWAPSGMATDESSLYVAGLRGNAVFF